MGSMKQWVVWLMVVAWATCSWAAEYNLQEYYPQTPGSRMLYMSYSSSTTIGTDMYEPDYYTENEYLFSIASAPEDVNGKSCLVQTTYVDGAPMERDWALWASNGYLDVQSMSAYGEETSSTVAVEGYETRFPARLSDAESVQTERRSVSAAEGYSLTNVEQYAWTVIAEEDITITAGTAHALHVQSVGTMTLDYGIDGYEVTPTIVTTDYWFIKGVGLAYMEQASVVSEAYDNTYYYQTTTNTIMELFDANASSPDAPDGPKQVVASVTSGQAPVEVVFSVQNYVGPISVAWDFDGDGWMDDVTSSRTNTWSYTEGGTFEASIEVWAYDAEEPDYYTVTVTVEASKDAPVMQGVVATATDFSAPAKVTFTANVIPGAAAITEYLWDFDGDGWADEITETNSTWAEFYWPGEWSVTMTAYDASGLSATGWTTFTVGEPSGPDGALVEPWDGDEVAGSSVMIGLQSTTNVTAVAVEYRAVGAAAWTTVGAMESWWTEWVVLWDTTKIPDGSYEIRATVSDAQGQQKVLAPVVTVTVVNAMVFGKEMPGEDEYRFEKVMLSLSNLPVDSLQGVDQTGARVSLENAEPGKKTDMVLDDLVQLVLPADAMKEKKTVRMLELVGDTLQESAAKARGVDRSREREGTGVVGIDLDAEGEDIAFAAPVKLTLRYPDVDNDGKEDVFGIDEKELAVFRKDITTGAWKEAVATHDVTANSFSVSAMSTGRYIVARTLSGSGIAGSVTFAINANNTVYHAGDTVTIRLATTGAAERADVYLALDIGGTLQFLKSMNTFHPAGVMAPLDVYDNIRLPDGGPQDTLVFEYHVPAGMEGFSCNWIGGVADADVPVDKWEEKDRTIASISMRIE